MAVRCTHFALFMWRFIGRKPINLYKFKNQFNIFLTNDCSLLTFFHIFRSFVLFCTQLGRTHSSAWLLSAPQFMCTLIIFIGLRDELRKLEHSMNKYECDQIKSDRAHTLYRSVDVWVSAYDCSMHVHIWVRAYDSLLMLGVGLKRIKSNTLNNFEIESTAAFSDISIDVITWEFLRERARGEK